MINFVLSSLNENNLLAGLIAIAILLATGVPCILFLILRFRKHKKAIEEKVQERARLIEEGSASSRPALGSAGTNMQEGAGEPSQAGVTEGNLSGAGTSASNTDGTGTSNPKGSEPAIIETQTKSNGLSKIEGKVESPQRGSVIPNGKLQESLKQGANPGSRPVNGSHANMQSIAKKSVSPEIGSVKNQGSNERMVEMKIVKTKEGVVKKVPVRVETSNVGELRTGVTSKGIIKQVGGKEN